MKHLLFSLFLFSTLSCFAQKKEEFHLWADTKAPTSNEITKEETNHGLYVENVTDPVLTVYVPEKPNGLAVIACPGGSYLQVWQGSEGHNLAEWYNEQGITYAVLKYRLPNGHKEVPLDDVHKALSIMKADPAFTHLFTRMSLIGANASEDDVLLYSNEKQVTNDTPQAFIMASTDDGLVPVRNSIEYYNALVANKVSAALHIYPVGGHGWCGNEEFYYRQQWMSDLKQWLAALVKK